MKNVYAIEPFVRVYELCTRWEDKPG